MIEFLQQLINGLALGSIYALIALGYTMVYGVLRFINFAHGDVFMVGAFCGFYLAPQANRILPPHSVPAATAVFRVRCCTRSSARGNWKRRDISSRSSAAARFPRQ